MATRLEQDRSLSPLGRELLSVLRNAYLAHEAQKQEDADTQAAMPNPLPIPAAQFYGTTCISSRSRRSQRLKMVE